MSKTDNSSEVSFAQAIALEEELREVKKEYGIEEKEGKLSKAISNFFEQRELNRPVVNRKKYLLLAVFTGWMGGHRFYAKQWKQAFLYLVLCWSGIPIAMTIIDLMIALPKEIDEKGEMVL